MVSPKNRLRLSHPSHPGLPEPGHGFERLGVVNGNSETDAPLQTRMWIWNQRLSTLFDTAFDRHIQNGEIGIVGLDSDKSVDRTRR